jgi:hypothetical protein
VRLVPEKLPITRRALGVLVDRHNDCLDVVIAPPFMHPDHSDFGQGFEEGRLVFLIAERDRPGLVFQPVNTLPAPPRRYSETPTHPMTGSRFRAFRTDTGLNMHFAWGRDPATH